MGTLEGRRILVVGGSAGIGRAFGAKAVAQGAHVAFSARRADKLQEAITEAGGGVAVTADITIAADCARLGADASSALGGPLDLVFISAGSSPL